jgi:general secretion pathway protein D
MFVPIAATLVAATPEAARAQPVTRGQPTLKTPPTKKPDQAGGAPTPGGAPAGGPATPGGAPGTPAGTPGAAGGAKPPDDPMAAQGVKTGPKEIDFKPVPGGYGVNFNLDDADLPDLVKAISQITGKRFIYGGKLRQIKATVYSPSDSKVTANEAYNAFLSILATNGMTVIPHGRFLKIVETPGIVTDTTQIFPPNSNVPDEDRYVTRMYRLAHIDANETAAVLTKFKSKDGDITVYPPGNLLIITETGANIQRMLRILEEIDVGGAGEQLWVEHINYTSASELANKLNDILDLKKGGGAPGAPGGAGGKGPAGGGGVSGPRVVADDKGNALVITATEGDYLRMLELIKRLDVKATGDGEIHVLKLQHAGCKDLGQTLNQILGTGFGGARPPGTPGAPTPVPGAPGVAGAAGSGIDQVFEGRPRITCDEATNSIVTVSSTRDYAQLRNVINQLDLPRRQVFIEAVIMDVSINRVNNYGIAYHAGAPTPNIANLGPGVIFGGENITQSINPAGLLADSSNPLGALAVGLQGPAITGAGQNLFGTGISIPALGVILHAMAQDGDNNILATPHNLALDNQDATISIGQNIPLQQNVGGGLGGLASTAGAAGAGALGGLPLGLLGGGFSAPRQDVGTKIKVKPHVNDSDQIRLELSEEISDAGAPTGALGAIPINKRTAETQLVVRDQQTVVIGGLVRDVVINSETKIPVLGDIPVLGYLFKQTTKTKTKSNLLLVLTPYVIRSPDDLRAIFERKMQERQEFIDRYFVFNEGASWSPPKDYRRANGLVEAIRQEILAQEERARIEAEAVKAPPKIHLPGQPIPLPAVGAGHVHAAAEEPAAPAGAAGPAGPGTPAAGPPKGRPARPAPGGGAPSPRVIERRE